MTFARITCWIAMVALGTLAVGAQETDEDLGTQRIDLKGDPGAFDYRQTTNLHAHVSDMRPGITVQFRTPEFDIGTATTDDDGDADLEFTPGRWGEFNVTASNEEYDEGSRTIYAVKIEITSHDERVPVGWLNQASVTATFTPPIGWDAEETASIELISNGAGSAKFDDAESQRDITETVTIPINGTANSITKNDVKIAIALGDDECDAEFFTVSTWPINFRQIGSSAGADGTLHFDYEWDSESGDVADLVNIIWGEHVDYPGPTRQPPYTRTPSANPYIREDVATTGEAGDDHTTYNPRPPYQTDSYHATQVYQFKDTVLGTGYFILMGPLDIDREIYESPAGSGNWYYSIHKNGASATVALP